nr:ATP synthase subunit O, mitochondrial-like [Tanacetum cinerariifolium]
QSRNFAFAAAKELKIKQKVKTLDKVEAELFDLVTATEKSPTLSQFMKDLAILADTRVQALTEIFDQAMFSEVTRNLLGFPCGQ